jgi:hypothetical protein
MTQYQGLEAPSGPGWWQASDGKWYAPETAPAPPPPPSSVQARQPYIAVAMIASVGILVAGVALALFGTITGGADEGARTELRAELASTQGNLLGLEGDLVASHADLASAQGEAAEAEAAADIIAGQTWLFAADAEEIMAIAESACGCSVDVIDALDDAMVAYDRYFANPTEANAIAVDDIVEYQVFPEMERSEDYLDRIRRLMVDRAPLPEGGDDAQQ